MNNMNQVVAYNLKVARIRLIWSQAFVSNLTGLSIRSISRAETGHSVSKSTLKRRCALYHIDIGCLYEHVNEQKEVKVDLVPESTVLGLLMKNSFISELQKETILRFIHNIRRDALMEREDVEAILPEVISKKQSYTLADIVACCLAVNQQTIHNIKNIAVS